MAPDLGVVVISRHGDMLDYLVGPGEETVRLHGIIYPHYMGGFGLLEDMRQEGQDTWSRERLRALLR